MLNQVLAQGKEFAKEIITKNSITIDATAGNGNDTEFLLDYVSKGKIYTFDIQNTAIHRTKERVKYHSNFNQLKLINDGHENVKKYVNEMVDVAIFNLGYLPNSNKSITTTSDTTTQAIRDISFQLSIGGRIIITIYQGHEAGKTERDAVLSLTEQLNQHHYNVLKYQFINQKNHAPFLIIIERKK